MSEPLTPEERAFLEESHRGCPCSHCTRRRELIAKVLAAHDAAIDQTWSEGTRADEAASELERLKQSIAGTCHRHVVGCDANEAAAEYANERIATATGLLVEWHSLDPDDEDPARSLYGRTKAFLDGQPAALEFDDTVKRLQAVALSHGWVLKSWGLQRAQPEALP